MHQPTGTVIMDGKLRNTNESVTQMNGNDVISALWTWFEGEDQSQSASSKINNTKTDFSVSSEVQLDKKIDLIKSESASSNLIYITEPKINLSNNLYNEVSSTLDLDYCEKYKVYERNILSKLDSEEVCKTAAKIRRITDLGFEFFLCLNKWSQCIMQKNERALKFLKYLAILYVKYSNLKDKDDFDIIALYHKDKIKHAFTNLIPKEVSKSCYNDIVDEMCSSLNRICMEVDNSHNSSLNEFNHYGNKNMHGKKSNSDESQISISNAKILLDLKYDYRPSIKNVVDPDLYKKFISKTFCRLVLLNKCSPFALSKITIKQWELAKQKSRVDPTVIKKIAVEEKKILKFINITMAIGDNFILIPQPCVDALNYLCNPAIRLKVNISPCNQYLFPSDLENPIDGRKMITEFCKNNFGSNFPKSYITNNVRRYIGLLNIPENVCNLINDHCPAKHTLMDSLPCNLRSIIACRHSFFRAPWEKKDNKLENQSYPVIEKKHSLPVFVSEHLDPTSLVKTEMLTDDLVLVDDDEI